MELVKTVMILKLFIGVMMSVSKSQNLAEENAFMNTGL